MKCGGCGREFSDAAARRACGGCAKAGGCRLARCPYCGYETAPEPGWLRRLRDWRKRHAQSQA